jgi:hypothetical protein
MTPLTNVASLREKNHGKQWGPRQRIMEIMSPVSSITLHSSFETQQQQRPLRPRRRQKSEPQGLGDPRSCLKQIHQHHMTVMDAISYPSNCLPWYYKQQLVFQINEVRRRLQFLLNDQHLQRTSTILPSSVPAEHRGRIRFNIRRDAPPHGSARSRMPGNLPKQDDKDHGRHRRLHDRFPAMLRDPSRKFLSSRAGKRRGEDKENPRQKASTEPRQHCRKSCLGDVSLRIKNSTRPSGKTQVKDWYIRETEMVTRPAYCSMEMISFDKESECFHRTEIAYPFQPCVPSSAANDASILTPQRRLAKTLQVQTAAVNNVYKHSLIWQ